MSIIRKKAQQIRLLTLDLDGILTTGLIFYSDQKTQLKAFHIHDGLGLTLLQKTGVSVAIISAKKSPATRYRAKDLGIKHIYLGYKHKLEPYEKIKKKLHLTDKQIAYMGDDLLDIILLKRVGLAVTVPHASPIVQDYVDFVTTYPAGQGAVRETCELIMQAQGTYKKVIKQYL